MTPTGKKLMPSAVTTTTDADESKYDTDEKYFHPLDSVGDGISPAPEQEWPRPRFIFERGILLFSEG